MTRIRVVFDIDKERRWRAALPPRDKIVHSRGPVTIGTLKRGMKSGKTSVMILAPLGDGETVVVETSLAALRTAVKALDFISE